MVGTLRKEPSQGTLNTESARNPTNSPKQSNLAAGDSGFIENLTIQGNEETGRRHEGFMSRGAGQF